MFARQSPLPTSVVFCITAETRQEISRLLTASAVVTMESIRHRGGHEVSAKASLQYLHLGR